MAERVRVRRLTDEEGRRLQRLVGRGEGKGQASVACLGPKWAGGRPRRITTDDETFIVTTAKSRPEALGRPFTRWSIRKLVQHLGDNPTRVVKISRERLRELLVKHKVTFQRTKTWKESNDPERDAKLDRIEQVTEHHLDRCFAFDEFGPLAIHPIGGCCWAAKKHPQRLRANYHKTCGVRQFHTVYSLGDDTL